MEQTYFPIDIEILRMDTMLFFDVFVKTSSGQYKRFHPASDMYTALTHANIIKRSIKKLYLRKKDKPLYYKYLEKYCAPISTDPYVSTQNKAITIHELVTFFAKQLLEKPDAGLVSRYKKVVATLTGFVLKHDDAIQHLIALTTPGYREYNHLVNVGIYSMGLAKEIFTDSAEHNMEEISAGFFLHDIGKYAIPKHILQKHGLLTDQEWKIIKSHPEEGYKLLKKFNMLTDETKIIVLQHHERFNGTGYPQGLKGDQIHIYGKICSIADSFDALTSHRPYRYAQSSFKALRIVKKEMKHEFDPKFFAQFVLLFSKT